MGTTEQKLNELKRTKQKLYAGINSLGGELTEQTPFRLYSRELSKLYQRLPKTSYQEGTNINLGKTLKAVVEYEDDKVLYGNAEQEGTPTPTEPIPISVVTGTQEVVVKNGNNEIQATYTIHLGSLELAKIDTYQDYIYFDIEEGKWYKKKVIEKKQVIGEPTAINTSLTNTLRINYDNYMENICLNNSENKCNRLISKSIYSLDEEGFYVANNSKNLILRINKATIGTTKAEVENYFLTNNTYIYVIMATATDEEITDDTLIADLNNILAMMSVEGTTIIEVSGNLPGSLKVRAVKGE